MNHSGDHYNFCFKATFLSLSSAIRSPQLLPFFPGFFSAYKGVIFKSFNKPKSNCSIRSAVCYLADKLPGQTIKRKRCLAPELYPVREIILLLLIIGKSLLEWLNTGTGCVVESPSLEIFKSHLVWSWATSFRRSCVRGHVGSDDLWRSLPTSAILWFNETQSICLHTQSKPKPNKKLHQI